MGYVGKGWMKMNIFTVQQIFILIHNFSIFANVNTDENLKEADLLARNIQHNSFLLRYGD